MTMKNITIYPGSMEVIGQALDKFGEKRVTTGAWNEPVNVNDLTIEEADFARKFFTDMECEVFEQQETMIITKLRSLASSEARLTT
jgi:hypothetical protein